MINAFIYKIYGLLKKKTSLFSILIFIDGVILLYRTVPVILIKRIGDEE